MRRISPLEKMICYAGWTGKMSFETLIAMTVLMATAAFTPGPNNAMLAASGVNFGFRRTVPHILGIAAGFSTLIFLTGFLLGGLFQTSALLRETLRWAGAGLLLYVAYNIARSGGLSGRDGAPRPMRFIEAAGFQGVNPKAWAMCIALTSQFVTVEAPVMTAFMLALVSIATGLCSASTWTLLGQWLRRFLDSPVRLKVFNWTMAALIVACIALLFIG